MPSLFPSGPRDAARLGWGESHFCTGVCRCAHLLTHCRVCNPCTRGTATDRPFKARQSRWEEHPAARVNSASDHTDRDLAKIPQCHEVHSWAVPGLADLVYLGSWVTRCAAAAAGLRQNETTVAGLPSAPTQTHPPSYSKAIFNFSYFSVCFSQGKTSKSETKCNKTNPN